MSKPKEQSQPTAEPRDLWGTTVKASDLDKLKKLKILTYGPSGAGKSRMASLFKRVLIGLTEHQAIPTITEVNPDAIIKLISGPRELMEFKEMIRDPSLADRVDAVVLDSLTDAQRILKAHFTSRQAKRTDVTDLETWGILIDATSRLAREVRDLPVHVMVTCLSEEMNVDGEGLVHRPAVSGKRLPNDLAQYFNLVGYAHVKEYERGLRHDVMFRGQDRWLTKSMTKLDDVEPPEPEVWISKVFGGKVSPEVRERYKAWKALAVPMDSNNQSDDNNTESES